MGRGSFVTPLGMLRIPTPKGLAFAREKLRACLVAAGLPRVAASQITAQVSQGLRAGLPAELHVLLAPEGKSLRLETGSPRAKLMELELPAPVAKPAILSEILAQLTREELLHDLERQAARHHA